MRARQSRWRSLTRALELLPPDKILTSVSGWIEFGIIASGDIDVMGLDREVIGPEHLELSALATDILVEPYDPVTRALPAIAEIVAMYRFVTHSGLIASEIMFHCDGERDVVVRVTGVGSNHVDGGDMPLEEMGSIIIHQIPEPTTIAPLGLGGLVLLRKCRV
jgi:hypothetical protein